MVRLLIHQKKLSIFAIVGFTSILFSSCTLNWRTPEKPAAQNNTQGTTPNVDPIIKQLGKPAFSLANGTYSIPQTLTITVDSSATAHCTTDGSTPTCNSSLCVSPITFTVATTVNYKAIACTTDTSWLPSDLATASYVFTAVTPPQVVADPTFSPNGGTSTSAIPFTISSATSGATIHYALGSSVSCSSGTSAANPVSLTTPSTVGSYTYSAIACKSGMTDSNVVTSSTFVVTALPSVIDPVFIPNGGTDTSAIPFTISSATSGATIHYALGSSVSCSSGTAAPSPVSLATSSTPGTYTYSAIACKSGMADSNVVTSAAFIINIMPTVANPVFSPNGGTSITPSAQTFTISSNTFGAIIHYALGSSVSCSSGTVAASPVTVTTSGNVGSYVYSAIACKVGWTDSTVVQSAPFVVTLPPPVSTPVFNPAGQTSTSAISFTITSDSGSTIHYTSDGSTPTCTSSPSGSSPLSLTTSSVVGVYTYHAIACKTGFPQSGMSSATYTITALPILADPIFTPPSGVSVNSISFTISSASGSTIYYTQTSDGSTPAAPTCGSNSPNNLVNLSTPGSNGIETTYKYAAIACESGFAPSNVKYASYTVTGALAPLLAFSPAPGSYTSDQLVTIISIDAGATIYYTLDGSDPACDGSVGTQYSAPVLLAGPNQTYTLKARACKLSWTPSPIETGVYFITGTLNPPIFNPITGTTSTTSITVTITSEAGSTIHYTSTTDGTTPLVPNCTSPVYSSPISLNTTGTYNFTAIACEQNWTTSSPASATYTITGTVADPIFNPFDVSGYVYTAAQNVSISSSTVGATIYYTLDGATTPVCGGGANIYTYSAPISLPITSGTYKYKAIACKQGWTTSHVVTSTYIYHCSDVGLSSLTVSNGGILTPAFDFGTVLYGLKMPISGSDTSVTPTAKPECAAESTITVNNIPVISGSASAPIAMLFNTNNEIDVVVTSTWNASISKTYTLNGKRGLTTQEAYIKKDTTPVDLDQFGKAIAIYGNTLVVGAENINGNRGSVYVFIRDNDGTWSQQQALSLSGGTSGDLFGSSVAIADDTIVVGARGKNNNVGQAYIFTRNSGVWTQEQANLVAWSTTNHYFGQSAAIYGKTVSGVTTYTIVIGANGLITEHGGAYIFVGSGSNWAQGTFLQASNADAGDAFGYSVSILGDNIAIGAYKEASSATGVHAYNDVADQIKNDAPNAGAVYLFGIVGGVWSEQLYIKASNTKTDNWFGYSVKIAGNYLVVGAPKEDSNSSGIGGSQTQTGNPLVDKVDSGAVYVFVKDSNGLFTQDSYIKASNSDTGYHFGSSLDGAISNSTGVLVVGAPGENSSYTGLSDGSNTDESAPSSGAAYVIVKETNGIRFQLAYVKASNTDTNDAFGSAVACNGNTIVVGAPHEQSDAFGINCSGQDPHCQSDNSIIDGAGAVYTFY